MENFFVRNKAKENNKLITFFGIKCCNAYKTKRIVEFPFHEKVYAKRPSHTCKPKYILIGERDCNCLNNS